MAPRRFEIEPSRIAAILSETFILERTQDAAYRYRLAGTQICEHFATEFRGSNFLDGWHPTDRVMLEQALATSSEQGGVVTVELDAYTAEPVRSARFEIVILPLVQHPPHADRFIGCWGAIDTPSWLGGARLVNRRVSTCQVIWPDGRPFAVLERQDRQAPFVPLVRSGRIVRSDRRQFRVYEGGLRDNDEPR